MSEFARTRVWALMILITLIGAFLRLYNLGAASLWDGEIFTLLFAQYDWKIFLSSVSTFSAHPPLWFALSKLAITGGWNETILRLPAAFAGIVSVPALYALSKRFFDGRVALVAAALLACSPLDVIFSQNARNYALFVLLTILLMYGAARGLVRYARTTRQELEHYAQPFYKRLWRDLRDARWWILFVVAALAGLYTHYLFVLPLAGTVLAIALKLMYDAGRQVGKWKPVRAWWNVALVNARLFLLALITITVLYLPWTPTVGSAFLGRQLTREGANEEQETALTMQDAPRLLKDFSGDGSWGLVLYVACAIGGIVWAARTKKRAALFWFGISILLPILVMILLAPRRLPAKYLIYVLPAYLMFVANGIIGIPDFANQTFLKSPTRARGLAFALVALLLLAAVPNMPYWNGRQTVFTGEGWAVVDEWKPWREVAASVVARAAPGDVVMFPNEARALTARSVAPYFDETFLKKLYSAPPTGRVWWVSEVEDVPAANAPRVRDEKHFAQVVVQQLEHSPHFEKVALANAGFENDFANWEKVGDAAVWILDSRNAVEGKTSARLTLRRPRYTTIHSGEFSVTPGKLYRVTAYVKNPTIGFYTVSPQLFVNFYEPNNKSPKRTRLATLVPTAKKDWVMMVAEGLVPDDVTTARIEFGMRDYSYALGATTWIDDVVVWIEK